MILIIMVISEIIVIVVEMWLGECKFDSGDQLDRVTECMCVDPHP
jgi:hypothetical protein